MLTNDDYMSSDDFLLDEDFPELDVDMLDFDDHDLPITVTPSPATSQTLVDEMDSSEQGNEESDIEE